MLGLRVWIIGWMVEETRSGRIEWTLTTEDTSQLNKWVGLGRRMFFLSEGIRVILKQL